MIMAILVLCVISLLLNCLMAMSLVRSREEIDLVKKEIGSLNGNSKKLTDEILLRLPQRPYGT